MLNGFGEAAEIKRTRGAIEKEFGVKTAFSNADMSKPADITGMVDAARRAFGKVDVLVNNAGIQHVEPVETFPVAKWDAIIAINLSAAFHAIRAVVPEMKARKWGRIINVASAHALVASPFKSAYVASKHGVLGLTKTVALETAEHGITVNAICPGYVLTPLVEKADSRDGEGTRDHGGGGHSRRAAPRSAHAPVRHHRADRCAGRVPVHRCCRLDHGRGASHRGRVDGAVSGGEVPPWAQCGSGMNLKAYSLIFRRFHMPLRQLHLLARHVLVRDLAQDVLDDIEAGTLLVVGSRDIPGCP